MRELRETCKFFAEEVENAYNNGELYDYLADNVYNVELRVDPDRRLRSVEYMLAGGGPNIYLDTKERAILGYWGGDTARYMLDRDVCDAIESDAAEMYGYEI